VGKISGTFCRTTSEAKTLEAVSRRHPDSLASEEVSVLIISISTKTIVGGFLLFRNKNLSGSSSLQFVGFTEAQIMAQAKNNCSLFLRPPRLFLRDRFSAT
jgi:hypothetical protein